jgi:hypothetical protein
MEISTLLGIALVVVGVVLAVRVAGLLVKLVFLALVAFGLYLWFGA